MNPCDDKVYEEGKVFAVIHGPAVVLEVMCEKLRANLGLTSQQLDWHYMGGWGVFKTLGDVDRAKNEMDYVMPIRRAVRWEDLRYEGTYQLSRRYMATDVSDGCKSWLEVGTVIYSVAANYGYGEMKNYRFRAMVPPKQVMIDPWKAVPFAVAPQHETRQFEIYDLADFAESLEPWGLKKKENGMKIKYKPEPQPQFPRYDSISVGNVFRLAEPTKDDDPNDRYLKIYTDTATGSVSAVRLNNGCCYFLRGSTPVILVPGSFVEE